jgi:hypothetical protein
MYDYSQCGQEKQWGKARECYQVGIDVDNLAEEFYQSLMNGYRIIEALGRQDCKQKPNGLQTLCKQTPFRVLEGGFCRVVYFPVKLSNR